MNQTDLKKRTKDFALRIIKLANALPKNRGGAVIANQLLRCGTSVGANYRSACRARSRADFISKLGIVEEEADESMFWLELIIEGGYMKKSLVLPLLKEADEIVSIIVATKKSARKNKS